MELQKIQALNRESLERLTGDAYKAAFEDPKTGNAFRARIDEIENSPRTVKRTAGSVRDVAPAPVTVDTFDPAFDDEPSAPQAPPAAAPAPVAVPVAELAEQTFEYQPMDEHGRPVGGKQSFKFRTKDELIESLKRAHTHATLALRRRKLEQTIEAATANITPEPFREPVFLNPRQPNAEEALKIAQLRAEGRTAEAAELEQSILLGASPADIARQQNELTAKAYESACMAALNTFKATATDYIRSEESARAIVAWVAKAQRNPTDAQSYLDAWTALKPLLTAQPQAAPAPVPAPAPVRTAHTALLPTGLSSADASEYVEPVAPAGDKRTQRFVIDGQTVLLDVNGWDRLSSDVQKRALRNRDNAAAANILYEQQAQDRAARRGR